MKDRNEMMQSLVAIPLFLGVVFLVYKMATLFALWIYLLFALVLYFILTYKK